MTAEEPGRNAGPVTSPGAWSGGAIYTLAFLTLISIFNYLDRSLLGLALPLIKAEMQVSDSLLGLISGFAFVVFYSLLGLPIAWAADRFSRRNIIAAGFAFWSLMTLATGFAANIWHVAITRFLMGAGEACGAPPSNSMVADLFPPARRSLALSLIGLAFPISAMAFFPVLGWIAEHHGWRSMFIVAGLPGLALAGLFRLTVDEPARQAAGTRRAAAAGLGETLRFLAGSRSYLLMLGCATLMGANAFSAGAWYPTFLHRVHHLGLAEIAATIGLARGLLGGAGIFLGGVLIDRLGRRDLRWQLRIPAIACILTAPGEALFLLADPHAAWLTGFGITAFFSLVNQAPLFALAVGTARVRMRAFATAVMLFCGALLGQGVGPLAVGFLDDALTPSLGPLAIRYSLLFMAATPIAAGLLLLRAERHLAADLARAAREDF
jgi:MFS family permease